MRPHLRAALGCAACVLGLWPALAPAYDAKGIQDIERRLGDKSATVRRDAANEANNAHEQAAAAVPKLLAVLAVERDPDVREMVVGALGNTGQASLDVPPALSRVLQNDPSERMRVLAAESLGRLATVPAVSVAALVAALADKSDDVRRATARALGNFGGSAESIVPALAAALGDKSSVANAALASLADFGAGAAPAVPAVRRLVATATNDVYLRTGAVWTLGKIGAAAAVAAPDCLTLLSNANAGMRVEAAAALLVFHQHTEAAMKVLVAALGFNLGTSDRASVEQRADVVVRAAWVIGHHGAEADGEAVIGLASAAADLRSSDIRKVATRAFDEVLAALVKARRFETIDSLVAARDFLAASQDEPTRTRSRQVAATIEELEHQQPVRAFVKRFAWPASVVAGVAALASAALLWRRRRAGSAPRVFISYRRQDSAATCGRLYDRLVAEWGAERVFRDIDSLAPGTPFAERLRQSIAECDAFVVLIGPTWLAPVDGQRRIDDPADYVRLEIEAAVESRKPLFPVLIEGARMPAVAELPPSVAPIAAANALELGDRHFAVDTRRLLAAIRAAASPG